MTADVAANLGQQRLAGERARHRHVWTRTLTDYDWNAQAYRSETTTCERCGIVRDEARSARGRSSRRRGTARELELARALGAEKVGHFGGPADVQSDLLVLQSKVRAAFPSWMTAELAKLPRTGGRIPALIVTDAPGRGTRRRSIVVLELADFQDLHGRITREEPMS